MSFAHFEINIVVVFRKSHFSICISNGHSSRVELEFATRNKRMQFNYYLFKADRQRPGNLYPLKVGIIWYIVVGHLARILPVFHIAAPSVKVRDVSESCVS